MGFELRPANEEDVSFIFELRSRTMKPVFQASFGWEDTEERKKAAEGIPHARIVLIGGGAAGVIKVIPGEGELHLHQMQILPEFQGQGIGRELLRQLIVRSETEGMPISLFVVKNTPAHRLYLASGFAVQESFDHHVRMIRPPSMAFSSV